MNVVVAASSAFLVTVGLTPLAGRVARRLGVVDRPGELKVHEQPTPYLGGVAVLCGLVVPVASGRSLLVAALVGATALGVADDALDLPPLLRLGLEIGIGAMVAASVPVIGGVIGDLAVVAATVVLVNAVNLIDGLDGLAAVTVGVGAAALGAASGGVDAAIGLALAAACGGFVVHNRPPASIYLGDGGSYLLGTALAALLASCWHPSQPRAVGLGAVAMVLVPVSELVTTVLRRARAGAPLFGGDRSHLYDRLRSRGWTVGSCVVAYGSAQALLGAGGWAVGRADPVVAGIAAVAAGALVVMVGSLALRLRASRC